MNLLEIDPQLVESNRNACMKYAEGNMKLVEFNLKRNSTSASHFLSCALVFINAAYPVPIRLGG